MASQMIDFEPDDLGVTTQHVAAFRLRYLLLAMGAIVSLFSVGGRWDFSLAAWLAPILLLRFGRISRTPFAIAWIWLVSTLGPMVWMWELAVPLRASSILGSFAFGAVLALPYLFDRLFGATLKPAGRLFLFPAALTACEFLMGHFSPLGTAYGLSAFTQHTHLALLQMTSIFGPYSIAFLIGWLATTVNFLMDFSRSLRRTRRVALAYAMVFLLLLIGGNLRLRFFPPTTNTIRIAGISPSMTMLASEQQILGTLPASKQDIARADPARLRQAFRLENEELLRNTHEAAQSGAKIVLWSENAAMLLPADAPGFLSKAASLARQDRIYLLVADNIAYERDETHLIDPNGNAVWIYQKAHPIPGFESYTPGEAKPSSVPTPHGRLAGVICYDADFPNMMGATADIMLVPGGDWPEMGQTHTQMSSLRAIENGYSIVRQDFNGMSAAYDYTGRVLTTQDTTTAVKNIMVVDVPNRGTATLYRKTGDLFAWLSVALTLILTCLGIARRRTRA